MTEDRNRTGDGDRVSTVEIVLMAGALALIGILAIMVIGAM